MEASEHAMEVHSMLNEKLDLVIRYLSNSQLIIDTMYFICKFQFHRERDLARKQVQELKHRTFQGSQFDDLK